MDKELFNLYKEHTDQKFNALDNNFKIVFTKLDMLYAFKWQIIGGSVVISSFLSIVIAVLPYLIKR